MACMERSATLSMAAPAFVATPTTWSCRRRRRDGALRERLRRPLCAVSAAPTSSANRAVGRIGGRWIRAHVGRADCAPLPRPMWTWRAVHAAMRILSPRALLASSPPPATSNSTQVVLEAARQKVPPLKFVALFAALFVVAALLAAAETAITTLWPWKVRELAAAEGDSSPFVLLEKDVTRFLTTILIAVTASTIYSTAVATEVATAMLGEVSVAYVTAGLTFFFLFFAEILPKSLAVHNAERVVRVLLPSLHALSLVLYPVGKVLAFGSKVILKLFNLYSESDAPVSEQELRLMIAGADRSGTLEPYESRLISNVLDLEEIDVRNVMCPRVDIVSLEGNATLREFLELESAYHFSRVPVFRGSIDNIVGVMHVKLLLRYLDSSEKLDSIKVQELADMPYFVPESMSAWTVLEQMRLRRLHMAIVVDEYGGTAGLVTLEDILEELVGEIYDEDDDYAETKSITVRADGSVLLDGQTELKDASRALGMDISEEDLDEYGTISGFLCDRMMGIPAPGDSARVSGVHLKVVGANDRRITSVQAWPRRGAATVAPQKAAADRISARDGGANHSDRQSGAGAHEEGSQPNSPPGVTPAPDSASAAPKQDGDGG